MTKQIKVKVMCSCGDKMIDQEHIEMILRTAREHNISIGEVARKIVALFDEAEKEYTGGIWPKKINANSISA